MKRWGGEFPHTIKKWPQFSWRVVWAFVCQWGPWQFSHHGDMEAGGARHLIHEYRVCMFPGCDARQWRSRWV